MAADAQGWAAAHTAALVGLPSAAAEQEVAEAGLRVRIAGPDEALTLDFRPDRVTLITDAADVVTDVRGG